jgi:hypothetical protein
MSPNSRVLARGHRKLFSLGAWLNKPPKRGSIGEIMSIVPQAAARGAAVAPIFSFIGRCPKISQATHVEQMQHRRTGPLPSSKGNFDCAQRQLWGGPARLSLCSANTVAQCHDRAVGCRHYGLVAHLLNHRTRPR